ncbi:hypothetical protein X754_13085 [Mesorhizobium sp. LNJC403B00]|nr:hypothetical protein X754_13085 [Mesorhizobium sp. LNJC403B00]
MTRGDPIAASDLADQLTTAAEKPGIPADQINGEIESVFELLLEVMRRESCARRTSPEASPGLCRSCPVPADELRLLAGDRLNRLQQGSMGLR